MSPPSSAHNIIASSSASTLSTLPTAIANIPLELLRAELARRQADDGGAGSTDGGVGGGGPAAALPSSKPACGTKGVQAEYSVSSHVFALVLILILSTVACAFPILARRFPKLPIPHHFLFLSRHFGTGVLIATAFVHLLPTAFHSLSDPCLPDFWTKAYTPMPGLVAMIAVLVVVGIEMFFASQGAGHVHGSDFDQAPSTRSHGHHGGGAGRASAAAGDTELEEYEFGATGRKEQRFGRPSRPRGYSELSLEADEEEGGRRHEGIAGGIEEDELDRLQSEEQDEWGGKGLAAAPATATTEQNGQARSAGRKSKDYEDEDDADLPLNLNELGPRTGRGGLVVGDDDDDDDAEDLLPSGRSRAEQKESAHRRNVSHKSAASLGTAEAMAAANNPALAQRLLLQCALLEAGILFHSVFIGMAVSVTRGSAFVVLLIAIAFHQTFEGFALGARISSIVPLLPPGSARPWLMCLAYGTTTPLGQAIGLAIHGLYDPKSEAGLILVGCMNAISSGLLLFAGLVELLAEDFLSENSYKILRGRRRTEACICVVLGSLLMAAVGAFA